jgi:hypothetical protein
MTSIPISARERVASPSTWAARAGRAAAAALATVARALAVWIAYVVLLVALLFAGLPAVVACPVGVVMVMAAAWWLGWLA